MGIFFVFLFVSYQESRIYCLSVRGQKPHRGEKPDSGDTEGMTRARLQHWKHLTYSSSTKLSASASLSILSTLFPYILPTIFADRTVYRFLAIHFARPATSAPSARSSLVCITNDRSCMSKKKHLYFKQHTQRSDAKFLRVPRIYFTVYFCRTTM